MLLPSGYQKTNFCFYKRYQTIAFSLMRDIEEGEELTVDYKASDEYWIRFGGAAPVIPKCDGPLLLPSVHKKRERVDEDSSVQLCFKIQHPWYATPVYYRCYYDPVTEKRLYVAQITVGQELKEFRTTKSIGRVSELVQRYLDSSKSGLISQ